MSPRDQPSPQPAVPPGAVAAEPAGDFLRRQSMLARTEALTHTGSWEWEVATGEVTWSDELFRILGLDPAGGALSFPDQARIYLAEDYARLEAAVALAVAANQPYELELRAIRPDGEVRFCLARGYPLPGADGKVQRLYGMLQDTTGQKRVEQALRDSERTFRAFFENLAEGVVLHTLVRDGAGDWADYRILDVNPAFAGHTGLTPASTVGRLGSEVFAMAPPPYFEQYRTVALGGAPIAFETYFPPLRKHFRISVISPKTEQFATVFEDITERKSNENEREVIVGLNALANADRDFQGLMGDLTAALQRWSGCEAVGIRLQDGADFPYFETRGFPQAFVRAESRLCATGPDGQPLLDGAGNPVLDCMCGNVLCGRFNPELPFFTAQGSFWSNCTTALLASTGEAERQARTRNRCNGEGYESVALIPLRYGGRTYGLAQFNDHRPDSFTPGLIARMERVGETLAATLARRLAVTALEESEATLRSYIDNSPIGVFVCNEQGRYLQVNPAASRITGYPREALLGMTIPELIGPGGEAAAASQFQRLLETGHAIGELPFQRQDGSIGHWSVDAVRLSDTRFLGFASDITARRLAEHEYSVLQDHLQQSQKMESLGILAGGIAHDMNNVLGAILSLASAHLSIQPEDSPTYPAFATIRDAAVRGGSMVRGLLDFARQHPSELRRLDLNSVLLDEVRLLERTTLAKVQLQLDLAPDLRAICGDASALTHAFMNLCVNAVDAMAEGGTLTLRTRNLDRDRVEVEVQDTGAGMTREVLDRALVPFFTTKEMGKGTGLGLAMVYRTVNAHGGRMELLSQPGQGTRVILQFPVTTTLDLEPEPVAAAPTQAPARPLSVLLVDDDELVQASTRMLLGVLGHSVEVVASGEEALAWIEQGHWPDVVVLDMNMPGLGGKGTLPRLRKLCPAVPVLLATGRADQDALDLVAAHPQVTLLSKPFGIEDLRGLLDAVGPGCARP